MSDRYEIDIEKKASSYLNSLATALGEGKKRALNELKQADTFVNRLFNRKKVDQLAKTAHLYAAFEHDVKSSSFSDKLANYEITVPEDYQINVNEFGKQIESVLGTYFKEQEVKLTPENSVQAYLDLDRTLSNYNTSLKFLGNSVAAEQETSLIGSLSTQNEYQNYVADYRESKPVHQLFPDQFREGMLERESKMYIKEYTKHLTLVQDTNRPFLKTQTPDYSVMRELEGQIASNFSKDPEYPIILLRTMATANLNKQMNAAVNMANDHTFDFYGEYKFPKTIQIQWHPDVSEQLTYEQYNNHKPKFLDLKSKDDDKMKQKENGLLLEKKHEIREPIKVEVQSNSKNSKQKSSKRSIGLER
ncbi:hypothetical protein MF621_004158 (plasmid) [Bacillus velezensis]|uniref:hypothetical protein n=1 Tax=Bacillus TaxID=1386 RepID=UPI0004A1024F|nr:MULTISPECIES: hypothetical protein [Bacillus amyloliquefaciens group]KDN91254.1 hypothetical protein EF87_19825 [Bacillus amyloliquefaciens]MED2914213.1 hypothetical protein [Bacillus velezensis]UFD97692.1 hypothetical protein [Bacillus amyloliquefaciens]URJ76535.1 hypothetical protein MF619_004177 [Bacillus velezensis]URJ80541.1 hypothetical protein MF621_004158 [Bacillus velezensis]